MDRSKGKVSILIDLFEQETVLWNVTSSCHKNSNNRNDAIERISNVLDCPQVEVERKLHNLRSQYLRENTKIEKSKKSGSGARDVYVPKWQFFTALSFLSKQSERMPHTSSMSLNMSSSDPAEEVIIDDDNSETVQSVQTPSEHPSELPAEHLYEHSAEPPSDPGPTKNQMPRTKKRPLNEPKTIMEKKFNRACDMFTSSLQKKKDEDDCFGEYVGISLKQLNDRKMKAWVRHSISNILFQAECGVTGGEVLPPAPINNYYSHLQPSTSHLTYTTLQTRSSSCSNSSSPAQSLFHPTQMNKNQPHYAQMMLHSEKEIPF